MGFYNGLAAAIWESGAPQPPEIPWAALTVAEPITYAGGNYTMTVMAMLRNVQRIIYSVHFATADGGESSNYQVYTQDFGEPVTSDGIGPSYSFDTSGWTYTAFDPIDVPTSLLIGDVLPLNVIVTALAIDNGSGWVFAPGGPGLTTAWNSGTTYNMSDFVTAGTGFTYISVSANNIGNDPVTDDGTHWSTAYDIPPSLEFYYPSPARAYVPDLPGITVLDIPIVGGDLTTPTQPSPAPFNALLFTWTASQVVGGNTVGFDFPYFMVDKFASDQGYDNGLVLIPSDPNPNGGSLLPDYLATNTGHTRYVGRETQIIAHRMLDSNGIAVNYSPLRYSATRLSDQADSLYGPHTQDQGTTTQTFTNTQYVISAGGTAVANYGTGVNIHKLRLYLSQDYATLMAMPGVSSQAVSLTAQMISGTDSSVIATFSVSGTLGDIITVTT